MISTNTVEHSATKRKRDAADVVVKGAIALVTAAIFLGTYLQFNIPFLLALTISVGVLTAFMALHTLVRRSERVEVLANEVMRLENEVANLIGRRSDADPQTEANLQPPVASRAQATAFPGLGPATKSGEDAFGPLATDSLGPARTRATTAAPPRVPSDRLESPVAGAALSQVREPQQAAGDNRWPVNAPATEPKNDYWSFRPANGPQLEQAPRREEALQPTQKSETDLEAVQGMLQKLAKEADVASDAPSGGLLSERSQDSAIKASADVLHSAAQEMRAAAVKTVPLPPISTSTHEGKGALPPPIVPVHARLSALGEAISADRVDVLLDPVLGFADAKAHHHEMIISLRDPRGAILPGTVRDPALAKTGLTPLLDSTRVKRAADVATSLSKMGHSGKVFIAASAESLESTQFLDALADTYRDRQELVGQVVLFFSQSEVRGFSGSQRGALADMRDLGFRFGIECVSDLNFDFAVLSDAGFTYLKLNADVLRKGLPAARGPVAANDISRYLGELGVKVIVGGVDHEAKRKLALDYGVRLGQGPLFGAPQVAAPQRVKDAAGIAAA